MKSFIGALAVVAWLGWPSSAAACTCFGTEGQIAWPTLEQAAAASEAVLIGRVTKQVTLSDPRPYEGNDVAYVEVEVMDGIKGVASGSIVRVWDAGFGTSCSTDLRPLSWGVVAAFAVDRNKTEKSEYFEIMRLRVAAGDYLLGGCGECDRRLDTDEDLQAVAATLRKATQQGGPGKR